LHKKEKQALKEQKAEERRKKIIKKFKLKQQKQREKELLKKKKELKTPYQILLENKLKLIKETKKKRKS